MRIEFSNFSNEINYENVLFKRGRINPGKKGKMRGTGRRIKGSRGGGSDAGRRLLFRRSVTLEYRLVVNWPLILEWIEIQHEFRSHRVARRLF